LVVAGVGVSSASAIVSGESISPVTDVVSANGGCPASSRAIDE
jgi:hypothetical protein